MVTQNYVWCCRHRIHTSCPYSINSWGRLHPAQLFHLDNSPLLILFVSFLSSVFVLQFVCLFPRDRCLSKDRVWHSRGIWCLHDCIKRMCGLRQRWTGTNPAAAFALDRTMPPSYLGGFKKKCLQCSLKTCHPSHMLQVFFFFLPSPSSTHDYVPWSITHFRTLWSFHIERSYFFAYLKSWNGSPPPPPPPLPPSPPSLLVFFHFPSQCKNQHLLFWVSCNWGERYSRAGALYGQRFRLVILVYAGCILGDGCISNKEFVTHFAEWALWCPPCWMFQFQLLVLPNEAAGLKLHNWLLINSTPLLLGAVVRSL